MVALRRALLADARGAVYVEFLIVIIPVLLLFMAVVQIALIASAKLIVQHAATRAARAAIVVLEDDPGRYGVGRGLLVGGKQSSANPGGDVLSAVFEGNTARRSGGSASTDGSRTRQSGARMQDVRLAAYTPLSVLAPSLSTLIEPSETLEEALGASSIPRIAGGMLFYNRVAAAVSLRAATEPDVVPDSISVGANVMARVTYLYNCQVPLARVFVCRTLASLFGLALDPALLANLGGLAARNPIEAARRMREQLAALGNSRVAREFALAESPEHLYALMATGASFVALSGEATLPNQGASYY